MKIMNTDLTYSEFKHLATQEQLTQLSNSVEGDLTEEEYYYLQQKYYSNLVYESISLNSDID